jgi:molybdopterin-containing oxidoreductase family iron-sulfur binding subunit
MEVTFDLDPKIFDGRYANVSWLQELPHPVTKLTWDNAALMNPTTAEALGIDWEACQSKGVYNAQVVELSTDNGSITMPAFVLPGVADYVVQLSVGYGQDLGAVSEGAGFSVSEIRAADSPGFRTNVSVSKAGETYTLASTQDHWSLVPMDNENYARPLVREALLDEYKDNPYFVEDEELMDASKIKSLWTEPNPREGQQWGMTIDLNSCTGCGACTVACQAENNIPSVGKERVLEGREMHWIRIDRYFVGPEDDAEIVNQPVNCMQCENAPCEQVCPVAATVHSPSGLNDMVYNRCIGTRYCANNCPYKVRRFNFFNFQKYARQDNPLLEMQRNPDVTPRFRGVMEKCTYCVQRINAARIEAKSEGNGVVPDGAVQTACQQVCPTNAIVFGAVSNSASDVSKQKRSPRNYALLSYLNTKPRTTYLAKVRNPNPELV